jgi:hypothetical protein
LKWVENLKIGNLPVDVAMEEPAAMATDTGARAKDEVTIIISLAIRPRN